MFDGWCAGCGENYDLGTGMRAIESHPSEFASGKGLQSVVDGAKSTQRKVV